MKNIIKTAAPLWTRNGKISHAKLMETVAFIVASFVLIKLTYTGGITDQYFLWYLSIVFARGAFSKFATIKMETLTSNDHK